MKRVTLHSTELATVDRGQGAVVVLVHGFPLDHRMWQAQIDALSARYRAIAPDLRGFGQSGISEGTTTMAEYADDVASLLQELEVTEPVVFCGLSMGGYVSLEFWQRHRERVRGLVLCDTRAGSDSSEAAAGRMATANRVLQEGPSFLVETMVPRLFAAAGEGTAPSAVEATRAVILATDPRGIAAAARGMAQRSDFTSMLGAIDVPVLVLVGQQDSITPPDEMRRLAEAIRGARLVEIPDAGHLAPLENPSECNAALLAFLAEITGPARATGF